MRSSKWLASLVCALFVLSLASATPKRTQAQGLVEYALVLVTVAQIVLDPIHPGAVKAAERLVSSLTSASEASQSGSLHDEIHHLGAAEATVRSLTGMYSSCSSEACESLQNILELVLVQIQDLKSQAISELHEE